MTDDPKVPNAYPKNDWNQRLAAFQRHWGQFQPVSKFFDYLKSGKLKHEKASESWKPLWEEFLQSRLQADEWPVLLWILDVFLENQKTSPPEDLVEFITELFQGFDDLPPLSSATTAAISRWLLKYVDYEPSSESVFKDWCEKHLATLAPAETLALQGLIPKATNSKKLKDALSADQVIERVHVVRHLQEASIGEYRIIVPIYYTGQDGKALDAPGGLVSLRITACKPDVVIPKDGRNADEAPDPVQTVEEPVVVAPWTFYLPVDDSQASLSTLTQNLKKFVETAIDGTDNAKAACLDGVTFLLELEPLKLSDVDGGDVTVLWPLIPRGWEVSGPSMGLGMGLAAWASSERKLIRPVIATGTLKTGGVVGRISGLKQKLQAVLHFLDQASAAYIVLYPTDNLADTGLPVISDNHEKVRIVKTVKNFSEVAADSENILTDGFDDWRSFIGISGTDPPDRYHAASPPVAGTSETEGFLQEDIDRIKSVAAELHDAFGSASDLVFLTLPFDEAPADVADYLIQQALRAWKNLTGLPMDQAVLLPVDLSLANDAALQLGVFDAVTEAVNSIPEGGSRPLVSSNAIRNAVQSPHKLVLVVFDRKSSDASCWDETRTESQFEILKALRKESGHQIIALCSDYHHECFWMSDALPAELFAKTDEANSE